MLNKQERTEIKKKGKKLHLIGYGLAIWGVALLVCCFATPLLGLVRDINANGSDTAQIIIISVLVTFIMAPLLGSLMVVSFGTVQFQKLYQFRWEVQEKRNRFHAKLFWDAIRAKDYKEAMRIYNNDSLLSGSLRTVCNGILMGIATQLPIDVEWAKKVDDRMNSYTEDDE